MEKTIDAFVSGLAGGAAIGSGHGEVICLVTSLFFACLTAGLIIRRELKIEKKESAWTSNNESGGPSS